MHKSIQALKRPQENTSSIQLDVEISLPAETQDFLLAFVKRQAQHMRNIEETKYDTQTILVSAVQ